MLLASVAGGEMKRLDAAHIGCSRNLAGRRSRQMPTLPRQLRAAIGKCCLDVKNICILNEGDDGSAVCRRVDNIGHIANLLAGSDSEEVAQASKLGKPTTRRRIIDPIAAVSRDQIPLIAVQLVIDVLCQAGRAIEVNGYLSPDQQP